MKKCALLCIVMVGMATTSCQNKTETGALTGAGIGAAAGAIIDGGGAGGVLIGGAIGALTGGFVGHHLDEEERQKAERRSPGITNRIEEQQSLTVADVIALLQAQVDEKVIMQQIEKSHTQFNLTTRQIIELKDNGASRELISFMVSQ